MRGRTLWKKKKYFLVSVSNQASDQILNIIIVELIKILKEKITGY